MIGGEILKSVRKSRDFICGDDPVYQLQLQGLLSSGPWVSISSSSLNKLGDWMRKIFAIGMLLIASACSNVNHFDAGIRGYEYVDSEMIGKRTYEVFRSEKRPDFYWAAIRQDHLCCVSDPIYFVNNVKAIKAVTGCEIDQTFVIHQGLYTEARVICPAE